MMRGSLALFTRGLRVDCRRWPMHLLRFLLVGAFLFFLFVAWANSRLEIGTAPGLMFFSLISYTNFVFITLAGTSFFTSSITEEKEEQTLGLLKMAGVSAVGILLGKLGPRLINALLLLAIQYPFVQLAVTLGGILPRQIQATYITLAGYIVLMSGMGLFCSVVAARTRSAVALMHTIIWMPLLLQLLLWITRSSGGTGPLMQAAQDRVGWVSIWSVVGRLQSVMMIGFSGGAVGIQFYAHLVGGAAAFLLAWLCFERFTRQPHTPGPERGGRLLRVRGGLRLRALPMALFVVIPGLAIVFLAFSWFRGDLQNGFDSVPHEWVLWESIGLAALVPLGVLLVSVLSPGSRRGAIGGCWPGVLAPAWKDLNFVSGGAIGLAFRMTLYSLITAMLVFLIDFSGASWSWTTLGGWMLGIGILAGTMELASNIGRGFRTEIQWQTLPGLMLLPRSVAALGWSKVLGGILALIPVGIFTAIGASLFFTSVWESLSSPFDSSNPETAVFVMMIPLQMGLHLILFVELSAFFALTVRWGYVALAFISSFFLYVVGSWGMAMVMMIVGMRTRGGPGGTLILSQLTTIVVLSTMIVVTYFGIGRKLRHLAGQS
ncbi:MAG: hypothetical protein QF363_18170 [Planctomycetaceae bacterium]|jgi:hypothetical protein|nr:hypothetical protein [Planctomycetaceae bacterium]